MRHGDWLNTRRTTDITIDDLKAAAKGHEMEGEEAADNIHKSAREMK